MTTNQISISPNQFRCLCNIARQPISIDSPALVSHAGVHQTRSSLKRLGLIKCDKGIFTITELGKRVCDLAEAQAETRFRSDASPYRVQL